MGRLLARTLYVGQLALSDKQPLVGGAPEFRGQRLPKTADAPAEVLDLLDQERCVGLAQDRAIDRIEAALQGGDLADHCPDLGRLPEELLLALGRLATMASMRERSGSAPAARAINVVRARSACIRWLG